MRKKIVPPMRRFLTPPEAAKILGVDATKVLKFIEAGELKAANLSMSVRARWKINPDDLDAFLESRSFEKPLPKPITKRPLPVPKKHYV